MGDASLTARQAVAAIKRREVLARLEGRVSEVRVSTAEMVVESYRLLLLPFWIGRYTPAERAYVVVVNSQTGTVGGERLRCGSRFARRECRSAVG